jgi:HEAT repeat protein
MRQVASVGKKRWIIGLLVVLGAGLVLAGWLEKNRLLARYYVYRLTKAKENDRGIWEERVASLEAVAIPLLVQQLSDDDEKTCASVQAALAQFIQGWDTFDPRREDLLNQLANAFESDSVVGKETVLGLALVFLNSMDSVSNPEKLLPYCRLLKDSGSNSNKSIRKKALELSEKLVDKDHTPKVLGSCRELIQTCLKDNDPENRIRAVHLGTIPSMELLDRMVTLLKDPSAQVRYAALLAVGPAPEVLATDDLLPTLHDPDPQVRKLCQTALKGRGLLDEHILLGRLLTDPDAKNRLQVLDILQKTRDLEPGIWLRRLSHDPSPAVRAAAIRTAIEISSVDLTDRLGQISQNDPSTTVRQLAKFYLSYQKPGVR